MGTRAASAPSTRDIFGIPSPYAGAPVGPGNPSMGLSGPNVPMTTWEPRGDSGNGPARWLNYGKAPTSHGHITLKSVDFIQFQYMCPPLNDNADLLLMPEMPCFTINELDADEDATIVLSHAKLNKLYQDQYNDFELQRKPGAQGTRASPTNPHFSDDAYDFHRCLVEYGERGLEDYAYAESHGNQKRLREMDAAVPPADTPSLKRFWQLSTSTEFCWLTRYGITKRQSFSGVIINTNRAIGLETEDRTVNQEHYVQVNVGIAKRVRCAQLFGTSEDITTGSKVWITLTRKYLGNGNYGAFKLQPGGSKTLDRPLPRHSSYVDDAGMPCSGHVYMVGTVIEPADRTPQPFAVEQANNTGMQISERNAYESHGSLPSMYLAIGFAH